MPKAADISTKKLISLGTDNWVKWVMQNPNVSAKRILNSEFQWIGRESDVLIRARNQQNKDFLIVNELQLRYKTEMPWRMRGYAGLAGEKYKLPVYPVLINILKDSDTPIPDRFESECEGLRAVQEYKVINLWEVDVQIVFEQEITSLLPLVPVLKDGGEESTIREALQLIRANERLSNFENVLGFFATFVLDTALVQQIMRWDMAILTQSPLYQQIVTESELRSRLSDIEMGLSAKFGDEGLEMMPQIAEISDLERLRTILLALFTADTLEEIRQML